MGSQAIPCEIGALWQAGKFFIISAFNLTRSPTMTPTENQKTGPSDEIDLGQLFQKVGDALRDLAMGFLRFLAMVRRIPIENKWSFLGITIVSILLAIAYSFLLKKQYYESTMILSSRYLNKRLVDNTIEKLDVLSREPNKSNLARLFNISDTLADNIIGFSARPFISETDIIELELLKEQLRTAQTDQPNEQVIKQVLEKLEIENRHSFEITIRTLNPQVIPNLQEALVNYFRNNDYVKRRIEINRTTLLARKEKLAKDLQKIDSLKAVIYANYKSMADQARSGSNNVILSDRSVTNPIEVYNRDLLLYDELQSVERQLYVQSDFEVVDGFTEFSEPASPSTTKMVLYALLLGIFVAYLDVAVRAFNNYLAKIE